MNEEELRSLRKLMFPQAQPFTFEALWLAVNRLTKRIDAIEEKIKTVSHLLGEGKP